MEQELQRIIDSGGQWAFLIMTGAFLKYIMTMAFLTAGALAFNKYLNKE